MNYLDFLLSVTVLISLFSVEALRAAGTNMLPGSDYRQNTADFHRI
jgi:hypothetical protein